MKVTINIKKSVLIILFLFIVQGCHPDWKKNLPNGYLLCRLNASTIAIWCSNSEIRHKFWAGNYVIMGIKYIAVENETVYGVLDENEFFLLDTKAHSLLAGIDERCLNFQLKQRGILHRPKLVKPRHLFQVNVPVICIGSIAVAIVAIAILIKSIRKRA